MESATNLILHLRLAAWSPANQNQKPCEKISGNLTNEIGLQSQPWNKKLGRSAEVESGNFVDIPQEKDWSFDVDLVTGISPVPPVLHDVVR